MDYIIGLVSGIAITSIPSAYIILTTRKKMKYLAKLGRMKRNNNDNITLGDIIEDPASIPVSILKKIPYENLETILKYRYGYIEKPRKKQEQKQEPSYTINDIIDIIKTIPRPLKKAFSEWIKNDYNIDVQEILEKPELLVEKPELMINIISKIIPRPKKEEKKEKEEQIAEEQIPIDTEEFEKWMKEKYGMNISIR
jgi:hypothetical protein